MKWRVRLDNFHVPLQEIIVPAHAHQQYTIEAQKEAHYRFICKKQSNLTLLVKTHAQLSNSHIELILAEEGATAQLLGYFILYDQAKHALHIRQEHQAPHTRSSSVVHAVLNHYAALEYAGSIIAHQHAKNTEATLLNKNVLLAPTAQIKAVPSLEVATNHIQCKHGTATSYVDSEQLFYMQSRGIQWERAQELVITSFLKEAGAQDEDVQKIIRLILKR